MDPTATLQLWIDATSGSYEAGDYNPRHWIREDLERWLNGGGFAPDAEVVCGVYWWCADCHNGQFSEEYAMLSLLSTLYKPGALESGPTTDRAREVYESLGANDGA